MQSVSSFGDMIRQFIGENYYYFAVLIALGMFLYRLNEKSRKKGILIVFILLLSTYNPISFRIAEKLGEGMTYYRFLWIIPTWVSLGYLIYELIRTIKYTIFQHIAVFIICAGILLAELSVNELKLPSNIYQITDEVIEVSNALDQLMTERGIEQILIMSDYKIGNEIRQYNAKIIFALPPYYFQYINPELNEGDFRSVISMLYYNRNDMEPEIVNQNLEEQAIDYIVLPKENRKSYTYLLNLEWEVADTTTNYYILQRREVNGR